MYQNTFPQEMEGHSAKKRMPKEKQASGTSQQETFYEATFSIQFQRQS